MTPEELKLLADVVKLLTPMGGSAVLAGILFIWARNWIKKADEHFEKVDTMVRRLKIVSGRSRKQELAMARLEARFENLCDRTGNIEETLKLPRKSS